MKQQLEMIRQQALASLDAATTPAVLSENPSCLLFLIVAFCVLFCKYSIQSTKSQYASYQKIAL